MHLNAPVQNEAWSLSSFRESLPCIKELHPCVLTIFLPLDGDLIVESVLTEQLLMHVMDCLDEDGVQVSFQPIAYVQLADCTFNLRSLKQMSNLEWLFHG